MRKRENKPEKKEKKMLEISEKAQEKIKEILEARDEKASIRIVNAGIG